MNIRALRALSLIRPYGTLIAKGLKPIEWRTWRTNYRGVVLLHTSASTTCDDEMKAEGLLPDECPLSAIIGAAIIVGCEWNSGHQQYRHICERYRNRRRRFGLRCNLISALYNYEIGLVG